MNIQFVYLGRRGGGVNDLTSLLNSIDTSNHKIFSLNNILIKNNNISINNDINYDYLTLPRSTFKLIFYIISFEWLRIFFILNKNKPEHIIITMFHPLNIFIFVYKYLFFKKIKIYYFLHNDNHIQTFNKFTDLIIRQFDLLNCFFSNKLFLLSDNVHEYARNHFLLKYKKMNVIGFGVYQKNNAIIHNEAFYKNNPITFLFFGKILPYKGLDILLNALDLLNIEEYNYKCYIIGEGELNYLNLAKNIQIFNEWVNDEVLENYINQSHFSIFPYKFCSQSGALSTAISNNIPVLVSDINVLSSYVKDNNVGFILTDLNAKTIANKIKYLDNNRQKLFSIHNNIINYNKNNNSWQDVWIKIYSNLFF